MKISSGRPVKRARIEIIPLIDVVFFLLATFVLFTLSLNKSAGLKVNLPEALSSINRDPSETVTISVLPEGTIAWNKDPISANEFLIRIKAYQQSSLNPKVLINGDAQAKFSVALYIFDEVRKAGIQKVFIETKTGPVGPTKS